MLGQQPVTPQLEKHYVYTTPSHKAIQKVKDKVKTKTYRSTLHASVILPEGRPVPAHSCIQTTPLAAGQPG